MPSDALQLAVVLAGTGAGAVIDLRTRRVPNGLTLALASAGVALAALGLGRVGVAAALAGGLLGLALMLPGHLFGATGGGDVKLFAASGMLLGPADTLWAFAFTTIAGGALALVAAAYRGRVWLTLQKTFRLVFPVRLKPDTTYSNSCWNSYVVSGFSRTVHEIEHPQAGNRFAYAPAIAIGAIAAAVFA
jgi:prepilin peptidase CpaA